MWFFRLIRQFFFFIDKIVFNLIPLVYDFLLDIARTSILTQADILDMANRVYKLLAIFMIFKVTFSLIMYTVNPDDFSDKNKGISKLGTNIIISLSLLILTPYVFSYAYQIQTIILEDNSLAVLIFGDEISNTNESFINSAGDKMAYITMAPFFTPDSSIDGLHECAQLTTRDSIGKIVFNSECSGLDANFKATGDKDSLQALTKDNDEFSEQALINYVAGVTVGNLGLMFREEMAVATYEIPDGENEGEQVFVMEYKSLFSTAVGIVVLLLLISFCLDVALRSVKLAFLQLVAPIPIISYVDPKSGKDGMFKKWYEMCFKTYISLFIRLLAMYFATYIISRVDSMVDIIDGSYVSNLLVKIVVIIGVLMFAKQLPNILEGLGIKLDGAGKGKFTLNPLRKVQNEALGGGLLKKPNDALANFAKDGFGLKTGAKKIAAGLDAKRNGKSFKSGAARVRGGFGKWHDKMMETWAPYSHEAAKRRREGIENLSLRDKYDHLGRRFMKSDGKMDTEKLKASFKNNDYLRSYETVADKKGKMFEAQAKADAYRSAIRDGKLVGKERIALARELGLTDDASDSALIQSLNKYEGTAKKQYDAAEARHAEYKKMHPEDALLEDSFDYYDKMTSGVSFISPYTGSSGSNSEGGNPASPSTGGGSSTSGSPDLSGGSDNPQPPTPPSPVRSGGDQDYGSPADDIAEQGRQNRENRIEEIEREIEQIKEAIAESKRRIDEQIEKAEEQIKVHERALYNEPDRNRKDYYQSKIDELKDKIDRWNKDFEDYKADLERRMQNLREELVALQ